MVDFVPLPALLSQLLVAFTIEFDNAAEGRIPHRTARGPTAHGTGPWLVSHPMWANFLRFVDGRTVPLAELRGPARMTNLGGLRRWGYLTVGPEPAAEVGLTQAGRAAAEVFRPLAAEVQDRWEARFGTADTAALRSALAAVLDEVRTPLPRHLPVSSVRGSSPLVWADTREDPATLDVSALLAQVLLVFTADYDSAPQAHDTAAADTAEPVFGRAGDLAAVAGRVSPGSIPARGASASAQARATEDSSASAPASTTKDSSASAPASTTKDSSASAPASTTDDDGGAAQGHGSAGGSASAADKAGWASEGHATAGGGSGGAGRGRLALPIAANALRVLTPDGVPVREMPVRAGVAREQIAASITLLERAGLLVLEPDPSGRGKLARATEGGVRAQENYRQILAGVEEAWRRRFGKDTVDRLEAAARAIRDRREALIEGLTPPPSGWRANTPYTARTRALLADPAAGLPHYPMVSHRGGYPDGS